MNNKIIFIDSEISLRNHKIDDLGAIKENGDIFHSPDIRSFAAFIQEGNFLCGHNIVHHDLKYLAEHIAVDSFTSIDTLYLSPLLFPKKPYHRLVKDDKLQSDELNNPLNDSIKARDLFYEEVEAFQKLPNSLKHIFCALLYPFPEFQGFFKYIGYKPYSLADYHIRNTFAGKICGHADIGNLIKQYPVELAYVLALVYCNDTDSITPPWILRNYPNVINVNKILRQTSCGGCNYCEEKRDAKKQLNRIFGFSDFRTYDGEPLQQKAAEAALHGESILTIFPTGGGKSVTFQLPAIMEGEAVHGLTVVIVPLQSLMKDQVDNLEEKGIADAVTINGLLSPIERQEAVERVRSGKASILYISPEQLRSATIENLMLSRNVVRFVIDEAHCFSAWGQDFRVDYLYIGDFIKKLQENKQLSAPIPVSCFTATAKQKVVSDIKDYFKRKLGLDLKVYATAAERSNLHYNVIFAETEDEKYNYLRSLITSHNCPTIIYVSRTHRAQELALRLQRDGISALPFHGKMETVEKVANQESFLKNEVQCIVATSAFGMGVDKKDVRLVVHFDISDSLENYVQESGRAGRDPSLQADCCVLFNNDDLDKHFILLNQTKLSIGDIQQVWKAIKDLTKTRPTIQCSALEIARQAGWDDTVSDIETRVRTAISALETAGYVKRGRNVPHVYATGILVKNMSDAVKILEASDLFEENDKEDAKRIIKSLISARSIAEDGNDDAESRVDYLADNLGLDKRVVIRLVNTMQQVGLLADTKDMSAFIRRSDTENKIRQNLERFLRLERYIVEKMQNQAGDYDLKALNEQAANDGIAGATVKNIRTIIYYWTIKGYIKKAGHFTQNRVGLCPLYEEDDFKRKLENRAEICKFLISELFRLSEQIKGHSENIPVTFSLVGLLQAFQQNATLITMTMPARLEDIEDALLYLSKIGAVVLQGGFLVSYNGMQITRLVLDNKIKYKAEDYRQLNEFYQQKIQQIHIVGEYANLMVKDYKAALQFVTDYFHMEYKRFIAKYFKGHRAVEIERNITAKTYHKYFDTLSDKQLEIIQNNHSKYIVVAAGPGSGKTRILVHKLATLLSLEEVKHEQLLMVTFSRAAATEFKLRLMQLTGNATYFVDIRTFHSYCFDLLGRPGNAQDSDTVVRDAAEMIRMGEVEQGRIAKAVVVIDEAQDMSKDDFALIEALMHQNEDMRVIAVGDDDQNIFAFRGSDSAYMKKLITDYGATQYDLLENYRSKQNIVRFSNDFVKKITGRLKNEENIAVRQEAGIVSLTKYRSRNMEIPLVRQVLTHQPTGSIGILTNTNEEAMRIVRLLRKQNRRARLIQSLDGFRLTDLAEVRSFLNEIRQNTITPLISDEVWKKAKNILKEQYAGSNCLEQCLRALKQFEKVNTRKKYQTDLFEFFSESKFEDFYEENDDCITVSTIHKAKGREFDNVYLLLSDAYPINDEEKRKIYVGLTRAKNQLHIHCNFSLFDDMDLDYVDVQHDDIVYDEPNEIDLMLTHRDVYLDFFKDKQKTINRLKSGTELLWRDGYFYVNHNGHDLLVGKISFGMKNKFAAFTEKGYGVEQAHVQFCVYWKGKEDENETMIFLPELHLARSGKTEIS